MKRMDRSRKQAPNNKYVKASGESGGREGGHSQSQLVNKINSLIITTSGQHETRSLPVHPLDSTPPGQHTSP